MKVVCIKKYRSQGLQYELTYGKIYDIVPKDLLPSVYKISTIDNFNYWIINDRGYTEYYSKDKFITLEEFRQRKLNQLGI
jgi:hypothetical protein